MKAEEPLKVLLEMVNKQANDATLWGVPGSYVHKVLEINRLQNSLYGRLAADGIFAPGGRPWVRNHKHCESLSRGA